MNTITDRLKFLRKNLGYSQKEFGRKINISQSQIASYEIGHRELTDRVVNDICREFNVNRDWLLDGVGEMYTLTTEDEKMMELFAELTVNDNPKLQKAILQLCELKEEYIDMLLPLITELSNKK